ncbi:MAG TPA: hypothetical protein PKD26_05185 [Pyrinomonadaceae bacterium]|nr:hypothetical protein [Pyrinomonadaceae bacterium]
MDLINDLGSDLAIAFLVEKKLERKIALREAIVLIDRVTSELKGVSGPDNVDGEPLSPSKTEAAISH